MIERIEDKVLELTKLYQLDVFYWNDVTKNRSMFVDYADTDLSGPEETSRA